MKNLTISNIAKAVGGTLYPTDFVENNREAEFVVLDSRQVVEGSVFIATRGERVDGHSFIRQVFTNGALAVICEKLPEGELPGPCIVVEDSFAALTALAKYYRDGLSVTIVGIVGSMGKTSTKEIVASVLSEHYNVLKTEGNKNNEVGVPLTLLKLRNEHEMAVIEMGISHFGEMERLSSLVRPNSVVMTNIGPCHLEFLNDLNGVLAAKSEVIPNIQKGGYLIVNGEDELLAGISDPEGLTKIMYGKETEVWADETESFGLLGTSFMLHLPSNNKFRTKVPLPGAHNVNNALAAAAVGMAYGLTATEIANGIRHVKGMSGRSNLVETDDYLVLDDCYNANAESMKAALSLMEECNGRKVAILGDIFELGEQSEALHKSVGAYAVDSRMDVIVCVGENSKFMYDEAIKQTSSLAPEDAWYEPLILYYKSRDELKNAIVSEESFLKKGDTILLKASHGMGFDELLNVIVNLSA